MTPEKPKTSMTPEKPKTSMTPEKPKTSSGSQTPKNKKLRRRPDGSPVIPIDGTLPPKTIYLIRHGQSRGQDAKKNGLDRKTDPKLRDCDLTEKGVSEALHISKLFTEEDLASIQLVISSPLTRALHTASLAFQDKNILVHYDLREVGSKVPENNPRDMKFVLRDLGPTLSQRDETVTVDADSLRPEDWPRDYSPSVVKKDRIRKVLHWIYEERPETTIAIVCHYNVIRSAVVDGIRLKPHNAIPIRCQLFNNGDLIADA
jgi:broad specificity phosphatase PhoE